MDDGRTPELRVGDDDRRVVDAQLQHAHAEGRITLMEYDERSERCWKARTQADLDALTRDLPAPAPAGGPTPRAAEPGQQTPRDRSPLSRATGAIGTVAVLAVIGYAGFQVFAAADGRAVLGDTTLSPAPDQDTMQVGMLLGDVTVVVPDGTHVRTTGTVLAGDVECRQACGPAAPGARTLVVDASGALGDLTVLTETQFAALPAGSRHHDDR